jgi:type IV pilus assembly protein PilW
VKGNSRGVTLIELLVSLAIVGMVLGSALSALVGYQRYTKDINQKRRTQSAARFGASNIERDMRLAGYGMEPAMAFDFTVYDSNGNNCADTGGSGLVNVCALRRDKIDGPDEIVFYGRNPEYWGADMAGAPEGRAWAVTASAGNTLTLTIHGGEYFGRGQILQLVCPGGAGSLYTQLSITYDFRNTAAGPQTLNTTPAVPGDPYQQSPGTFVTANCGGQARAFLIERFRYYVEPNTRLADGTTDSFLILDKGVDRDNDGDIDNNDLIPVARNVVDLQVAYVRPEPALTEVGAEAGKKIKFCDLTDRPVYTGLPTALLGVCADGAGVPGLRVVNYAQAPGASAYSSFSYLNAPRLQIPGQALTANTFLRVSPDAANINGVHVVVVSISQDAVSNTDSFPLSLNRNGQPAVRQNVSYSVSETIVPIENTRSRSLSYL